ncbi:hypothetical protein KY363_02800 [Candidatus Woesearchaeota archaeon]|nr:hypothetical protein [Candidatus Woesearchaeota archaeon]
MTEKRGKTTVKASKKTSVKSHSKHAKHPVHKHPVHKKRKLVEKPVLIEEQVTRPPHELEQEFFVPSPIHRGKYAIPVGIKFLIGYLSFLAVLYIVSFLYGITFPTTLLFGELVVGTRALVINSVLLGIVLLMVYGFWRRHAYTFDLAIGFFSFSTLNAMLSLFLFQSSEHPMFRNLLLLSFISLIVMNIVIVWYILHERKYFFVEKFRDRPWLHRDRVFLYCMITFWAVTLLIGGTIGYQFYKDTTRLIDQSIAELKGDYYTGVIKCEQKTGPERDVCTLVIATILSEKMDRTAVESRKYLQQPDLEKLCNTIQSDFYRFTCMRSIKR